MSRPGIEPRPIESLASASPTSPVPLGEILENLAHSDDAENKEFPCENCEKSFETERGLKIHRSKNSSCSRNAKQPQETSDATVTPLYDARPTPEPSSGEVLQLLQAVCSRLTGLEERLREPAPPSDELSALLSALPRALPDQKHASAKSGESLFASLTHAVSSATPATTARVPTAIAKAAGAKAAGIALPAEPKTREEAPRDSVVDRKRIAHDIVNKAGGRLEPWVKDAEFRSQRNKNECSAIAKAVDFILANDSDTALEVLVRRLVGVHSADASKDWNLCSSLEWDSHAETLLPDRVLADALKRSRQLKALSGVQAPGARPRATAWTEERSTGWRDTKEAYPSAQRRNFGDGGGSPGWREPPFRGASAAPYAGGRGGYQRSAPPPTRGGGARRPEDRGARSSADAPTGPASR